MRHFMNPSNFGITVTLLAFSWVNIAPPYHFTENVPDVIRIMVPTDHHHRRYRPQRAC